MKKAIIGNILLVLLGFVIFPALISAQNDEKLAKADKLVSEADKLVEQNTLESLESAVGKIKEVRKIYEELKMSDKVKSALGLEGIILRKSGFIYLENGNFEKSAQQFQASIELFRRIDFPEGVAESTFSLGYVAALNLDQEKALAFYMSALKMYRQLGNDARTAITSGVVGYIYVNQKDFAKADESFDEALAVYKKLNQPDKQAEMAADTGFLYLNKEKYENAEKYYLQALLIYRTLKDEANTAVVLQNLALIAANLNYTAKSLDIYKEALKSYQAVENKEGEFYTLTMLGLTSVDEQQYQNAVEYLTKASEMTNAAENKKRLADIYFNLGISYQNLFDYENALKNYEKSLKIRDEPGQNSEKISVLNRIGQNYLQIYKYEKANEFFERELKIAKDEGLISSQILALTGLSKGFYQLNQSDKSKQYLAEAVELSKQIADDDNYATAFRAIGENFSEQKRYAEAQAFLTKAADMFEKTDDKESRMFVLFDLGYTYFATEQYENAADYYRRVQNLAVETDNDVLEGFVYIAFGEISYAKNNFAEAVKFYDKALYVAGEKKPISVIGAFGKIIGGNISLANNVKIITQVGDVRLKISAWYKLGAAQNELGKYKDALGSLGKSLKLAQGAKSKYDEMAALGDIATSNVELGNYAESLQANEKALQLTREMRDLYAESIILNNLGVSYLRLGSFEKAEDYVNQSAKIVETLDDPRLAANAEANLGAVYVRLKQYDKALSYLTASLPKLRSQNNSKFIVITSYYLGTVLRETGKPERAVEIHLEAVETAKNVSPKFESRALTELGLDYIALKKFDLARTAFENALNSANVSEARDEKAAAFDGLMQAWQGLKKTSAAIFYGKQAVNLLQETRGNVKQLDKDVQANLVKDKTIVYRRLADLLIAEGRLPEAQAVLDLLKEEEFSGLITRGGNAEENVPYSKAEASSLNVLGSLAALGREKSELAEKLSKGSLTDEEKGRYKEISKEIETAEAEFNKSLLDLSSSKNAAQNFNTVVKDAQAFMSDLKNLGAGTVALYTVIVNGENQDIKTGWIILVTPEFRKQYKIDVADLEKTVFEFRAALKDDVYDPTQIAQTLYAKIFRQKGKDGKTLEEDLDVYFKDKTEKTLMWSLDGVLRYVPMAALHDGKGYLIERYRNTIFNTASKGRLSEAAKANWTVLGLGVSEAREESGKDFPKIEGTKRELDSIVAENEKDAGIMNGTVIMDEKFTAEAMEDALLFDKNPVVHIASHFSFNTTDTDASFLLLGKGKLSVKELTAKSTLFENIDLLTLSACDTAMGNSGTGKEVEGFAYIAQSLGAKAVLASLWQVADTGTDELMIRFYKLRKENPQMPKGEAFRRAQLAMLGGQDLMKNTDSTGNRSGVFSVDGQKKTELLKFKKDEKKPFAHPHYWAAFVLIGNWR